MSSHEEEVAGAIRAALRIVEEAEVPDDLRAAAFQRAFDALSTAPANNPAMSAAGIPGKQGRQPGDSPVDRAASKLGVDRKLIERVLDFDQDGVHIMAPRSRFAKQKSAAIQQLATLLVAARQAAGIDEEWTSQSIVREATEELGVEDPSNFATHMKRLNGIRSRGSGKTGELKMNAVGFEAAAALIRDLAQSEAP